MIAKLIRFEAWYAETGAALYGPRILALEIWRTVGIDGLPDYPREVRT